PAGQRLRGAVLVSGEYMTTTIDPVINAPLNEYVSVTDEPRFQSEGFYPPQPFVLRGNDDIERQDTALTIVMGQHDSATGVERLYTGLQYDVYFSALGDE